MPANVSFGTFDAFSEIPEHLVDKYDVVHIRCFVCIVKNNDPSRLLANLVRMLSALSSPGSLCLGVYSAAVGSKGWRSTNSV